MDQSPLVLQSRPTTFKPKILELYESLFQTEEDVERPEGFWQEFFLHKPEHSQLRKIISGLDTFEIVQHPTPTQQLFARAITCVNDKKSPQDEVALETLTVFLDSILHKKYTSPSSDIIAVLAGIDEVDIVFTDFVGALEAVIKNGRSFKLREQAIGVAISAVAGAYKTALVSYFINRDLFPALMKFMHESDSPSRILTPYVLLGLLVNYNKFEFSNPYRLRLEDFVGDSTVKKVVQGAGAIFATSRNAYVAVQDDLPDTWDLSGTLAYIGLGTLVKNSEPTQKALSEEEIQKRMIELPFPDSAILLTTYDFSQNNKLFCFNFVSQQANTKGEAAPFSAFLSLTSYICQNANRSTRASLYACTTLLTLQVLVEDNSIVKTMCTEAAPAVRLCRQRQPFLPAVKSDRVHAVVVIDILVDTINHNLRKRFDINLYLLLLNVLTRLISFLGRSRTRLQYHWSELWRAFTSVIRFFNQYPDQVKPLLGFYNLADVLLDSLALSLSTAEAFLPDPKSYDDLFYKVVEAGETLLKFKDIFELSKHCKTSSIDTLLNVSEHYYRLFEEQKGKKLKHLSPRDVSNIIKQGYDTLSIEAREGLDSWEKYREAEYKSMLKKVSRIVVQDARLLVRS